MGRMDRTERDERAMGDGMDDRRGRLRDLEARLARLEGRGRAAWARPEAPAAGLFVPAAVNEVIPAAHAETPAALGLALAGLMEGAGEIPCLVWFVSPADDFGQPYPPGLAGLGFPANHLITVRVRREGDMLWGLEEALRARAKARVLAALARPLSLTASRRLLLAAEAGGGTAALLLPPGAGGATVAATRWRVRAAPSQGKLGGEARWHLRLLRRRHRLGSAQAMAADTETLMEWDHASHRLRLVAPLRDRARVPGRRAG